MACPKCGNPQLTPFRDRQICLKCNWGTKQISCDSCGGPSVHEFDCGCVQCKLCPRVNSHHCDTHRESIPEKTYIEGVGTKALKWFKKDKHRLFILNGNNDIIYGEHKT